MLRKIHNLKKTDSWIIRTAPEPDKRFKYPYSHPLFKSASAIDSIQEPETPCLDEGYTHLCCIDSFGDGDDDLLFSFEVPDDPFNLNFLGKIELELNKLHDDYSYSKHAVMRKKIQQGYETLIIGYLKLGKHDKAAEFFSGWCKFDEILSSKTKLGEYAHPYNLVDFFNSLVKLASPKQEEADIKNEKLIPLYKIDTNLFAQAFKVFCDAMKPDDLMSIVNQSPQFAEIFSATIPLLTTPEDKIFSQERKKALLRRLEEIRAFYKDPLTYKEMVKKLGIRK